MRPVRLHPLFWCFSHRVKLSFIVEPALSFLGHEVESVLNMQQYVARQDVAISFGAALRVYGVCHIVQLVQKVKSVEHEHERTLGRRVCHACVPHKVGGVHHLVHIASAGVEVQVGRQSEA